jgi:His-Xaa-Ser system protein HxsD
MEKIKNKINKNQIIFYLSPKVYSLEVIYSAANSFLNRAYVLLDCDSDKKIKVELKGKVELSKKQLEALAGEFCNEILNCLLRAEITKSNQKLREYVVASALVSSLSAGLAGVDEEVSQGDWREDPLGISVPWEKKFKKAKK